VPDPATPQSLNRYSYGYNNPVKYQDPTGHYAFEERPDDPYVSLPTLEGPLVRSVYSWTAPRDARSTDQFLGLTSNDWSVITVMADGTLALISVGGELAVACAAFGLVDPPAGITAEAFAVAGWFGFFKPASNVATVASIVSTWASGVASGDNMLRVENGSFYVSVSQDLIVDVTASGLQTLVPQPDGTLLVSGAAASYDIGRIDATRPIFGLKPPPGIPEGMGSTLVPTLIRPSLQISSEGIQIKLGGGR
jgi:hypothetical protein